MASKRRNMFYENKKQETTEIDSQQRRFQREVLYWKAFLCAPKQPARPCSSEENMFPVWLEALPWLRGRRGSCSAAPLHRQFSSPHPAIDFTVPNFPPSFTGCTLPAARSRSPGSPYGQHTP
ncbi:hypothetical protein AAG570_008612 [Ranatra chinensis]|uniref:Uncharacterized protein n=1 Tax=Ranatra chinensis TaxID=642074 RepID=A0ABD0YRE9_9HEMI